MDLIIIILVIIVIISFGFLVYLKYRINYEKSLQKLIKNGGNDDENLVYPASETTKQTITFDITRRIKVFFALFADRTKSFGILYQSKHKCV